MTTKLKLASAFTDTTLPKFKVDPILPDAGALFLLDPTHAANPWAAGVPTDGTTLPNIAEAQALSVLATTDVTKVRPVMKRPASFTGTAGLVERTGKGGLHAISPQGGNALSQSGPSIYLPTALIAYILAHPENDYYASVWARLTRQATVGYSNSAWFAINGNGQQTNSYLVYTNSNPGASANIGVRPSSLAGGRLKGGAVTEPSTLGPHFVAAGVDGWGTNVAGTYQNPVTSLPGSADANSTVTGTFAGGVIPFGASAAVPAVAVGGGTTTGANIDYTSVASNKNLADSHAIYRVYLEDLTVSGRTYAQVVALDQAQYNKDVLTAGGRYFGDTFTDPTTIP